MLAVESTEVEGESKLTTGFPVPSELSSCSVSNKAFQGQASKDGGHCNIL